MHCIAAVIALPTSALRPAVANAVKSPFTQLRPTIALTPMLPSILTAGASILTTANISSMQHSSTTVQTPGGRKLVSATKVTVTTAPSAGTFVASAITTAATTTVSTTQATVTPALALGLGHLGSGIRLQQVTTPMTQLPAAQLMTSAQLQALMTHMVVRDGTGNQVLTASNLNAPLLSPGASQVTSLQGLQTLPTLVTQLMQPVTVVSPATAVPVSTPLTQPQLQQRGQLSGPENAGATAHHTAVLHRPTYQTHCDGDYAYGGNSYYSLHSSCCTTVSCQHSCHWPCVNPCANC